MQEVTESIRPAFDRVAPPAVNPESTAAPSKVEILEHAMEQVLLAVSNDDTRSHQIVHGTWAENKAEDCTVVVDLPRLLCGTHLYAAR